MQGIDRTSLSEDLMEVLTRQVGPRDRQAAALHLLDWLGCALLGRDEPVGRALARIAGADPLALAGRGTAGAALALGGLGSLLEMDDVHKEALLHPGPVIAATVMALPQGGDPLAALVRGYEAMIRLGRAVGPAHYARFHNTGTCGGIGAAVAAADCLGLSTEQTVHAIGHAVSLSAGLWQCRNEPGETKHLHVAEAARRGLMSARYAQEGLAGPRFVLEGPQGFFAGLAPDGDPVRVIEPTPDWFLHEVSFKPWPACRHTHAAIDAALELRSQIDSAPAAIRIATFADALLFCDNATPATAAAARFSLQHAVAVALREGPPTPGAFLPDALPAMADLRAITSVVEDPALTAAYPARFGAEVMVTTTSGARIARRVTDAWGDPENPMNADATSAKFHRLATAAGLTEGTALRLEEAVQALADNPDPSSLHKLLHGIASARTTSHLEGSR